MLLSRSATESETSIHLDDARHPDSLLHVRYALPFEGVVRVILHAFKYRGAVSQAGLLAAAAAVAAPADCNVIVPIPLHATRRRERGYNQTLLIAHGLGYRMALPVAPHALERTRATESQARLDRELRFANTLGAFRTRGERLSKSRVLLLDDVVTTGATLSAAAAAVLNAGADSVSLLAVAGPAQKSKPVDSDLQDDYSD